MRTILFDYRKAFDLIDHKILVDKLCALDLPNSIINWIMDFSPTDHSELRLPMVAIRSGALSLLVSPRGQN